MLYKRKPSRPIDAVQYIDKPVRGMIMDCNGYYVTTIHDQKVYVVPSDWIVAEPDNEHYYYPIKDKVFNQLYEPTN